MSNKTILFADDSATMRHIVEKTFAAEPYAVICVPSGEGAVTKAKEVKPDVIIVDAGMPGVSGYDVCSAVRSDPATKNTPVVIMSGVSSLYDESRGQSVGVTEHMKKPFDTGLLIELVGGLTTVVPLVQDVPLEDVEPEDLPLLPISEPPLPEPEELSLSEPPIPLAVDSSLAQSGVLSRMDAPFDLKPVGKQTQDYARPSSPPIDVHIGDPLPIEDDDAFGEEVDFGDDADDFPETDTTSDVPPIEIDTRSDDADSGSFHVGTLAELAQMDSKGAPLSADPHENAIELSSPSASSLDSLGPKMSREASAEPSMDMDTSFNTVSDIPDLPETDDDLDMLPDTEIAETEVAVEVETAEEPLEPSLPAASPYASAPVTISAVRDRVDDAAAQIAAKVEGITPAQAAAIQTLTREIIERVVWEVVPDLAEVIIKEELAKLLKE